MAFQIDTGRPQADNDTETRKKMQDDLVDKFPHPLIDVVVNQQ